MHAFVAENFYVTILKPTVGSFYCQIRVYIVFPYGYVNKKNTHKFINPLKSTHTIWMVWSRIKRLSCGSHIWESEVLQGSGLPDRF
jgi:hypothetical protein